MPSMELSQNPKLFDWRNERLSELLKAFFKNRHSVEYFFDDNENESSENHTGIHEEAGYTCNSCGEEIIVPLDFSEGQSQQYIEDCPVCCNPNIIFVEFDGGGEPNVWSRGE